MVEKNENAACCSITQTNTLYHSIFLQPPFPRTSVCSELAIAQSISPNNFGNFDIRLLLPELRNVTDHLRLQIFDFLLDSLHGPCLSFGNGESLQSDCVPGTETVAILTALDWAGVYFLDKGDGTLVVGEVLLLEFGVAVIIELECY